MFRRQEKKNSALEEALDRNKGSAEAAREALERGADVNARFTGRRLTALHLAACLQDPAEAVKAVSLLLSKGIGVNVKDGYGYTPLSYAASETYYEGRLPVAEKLLAEGASCTMC